MSFKIPGNFILLASHNDRLVIHFSDQHCISAIQNILAEWEREMGMPMLDRSYSRTEIAADRHDTSFSDFIAQHYAKQLLTGKYSIQAILLGAIEASSTQGFTSKKSS